ncbi:hypothetical protein [Hymenobacter negativus]|uniref:Uncharacterized protein n=1 Tax=Hymenobacter negativus TaxID=2795026 RepID=A0ABS3QK62_9BACT|nr:hypothetical protein [Hymenobacter negativus]MBO2011403.1 hypothetical protein [Hymenobacter negativus]
MSTATRTSATARTLAIWFLTNLGGTTWLVIDFCRESPTDAAVPLIIGLVAAIISLIGVPLAIPFFALAQAYCTGWRCRLTALVVVLLSFAIGNYLLINMLPIGPVSSLLSISKPYLVATVLAVMWVYRPRPAAKQSLAWPPQSAHVTRRVPIKLSGMNY